ncbi:hypothetical protein [Leuconostoc mesenteroides]|uniref:hypothetical protein n=1 Tax=Leuconostoc mesenteroides TaxID=1245 RepID=UPI0023620294|nr:hypothetical protein [Leuconostoc mesenteroides]
MTEPVAYLQLDIHGKEMVHIEKDMNGYETKPLYTAEQLHPRVKMTQAEFDELEISLINAQFDYSELKKTIEIVPDMKWFVRGKKPNGGYYAFLESIVRLKQNWCYSNDKQKPYKTAVKFDTKEEAELWLNPLTEAVQLPVEGE